MKLPKQPKKSKMEIWGILHKIEMPGYRFALDDRFLFQVVYDEPDVDAPEGSLPVEQRGRKWYISPYSTETEIVRTVYKALLTSLEHQLGEHFKYKGLQVYSPHLSVESRLDACAHSWFDRRFPPEKEKP